MGYIKSGKDEGATMHCGGHSEGRDGFFIKPTLFTDVNAEDCEGGDLQSGWCSAQV